jgi:hypothetical protein
MKSGVKTESIDFEKLELKLQAKFLILALKLVYNLKVSRKNIRKLLYIAYGLSNKESKVLLETLRGKISNRSEEVNQKCIRELIKFLSFVGKYNGVIKIVFRIEYEF